jgi:hypothetical protein
LFTSTTVWKTTSSEVHILPTFPNGIAFAISLKSVASGPMYRNASARGGDERACQRGEGRENRT